MGCSSRFVSAQQDLDTDGNNLAYCLVEHFTEANQTRGAVVGEVVQRGQAHSNISCPTPWSHEAAYVHSPMAKRYRSLEPLQESGKPGDRVVHRVSKHPTPERIRSATEIT